jgi:hypothetical protein
VLLGALCSFFLATFFRFWSLTFLVKYLTFSATVSFSRLLQSDSGDLSALPLRALSLGEKPRLLMTGDDLARRVLHPGLALVTGLLPLEDAGVQTRDKLLELPGDMSPLVPGLGSVAFWL